MIDFGRVMYTSNNLTSAAREGARFGAVMNHPVNQTTIASIDSVVKARFNSALTFGGTNLTNTNIDIDTSTTSAAASP